MAATGTPTPNIGLRRAQGTDPASVDDINYNSALIDTKLGAVGNSSVQDQIDTLNSKISSLHASYVSNIASAKTIFNDMGLGEVRFGLAASDAATALYDSHGTGFAILSKSATDRWEIIGISFNRGRVSVLEIDANSTGFGTAKKVTLS